MKIILLKSTSRANSETLRFALEDFGFLLSTVESNTEVFQSLEERKPDLLIIDLGDLSKDDSVPSVSVPVLTFGSPENLSGQKPDLVVPFSPLSLLSAVYETLGMDLG